MAKKSEAVEVLAGLRNAFHPTPEIATETWKVYVELLTEFDAAVLADAARFMAKTSKWFPSIAELRAACLEISGQMAKLPAVGEAYAEARRAAFRFGARAKVTSADFSNALVLRAAVQTAGSWSRWCLTEDEAPTRARFFEVYRELREREVHQAALQPAARHLTAEESRALLEDLQARTVTPLLAAGGEPKLGPAELGRRLRALVMPRGRAIVGETLTDEEWAARKAAVIGRAEA